MNNIRILITFSMACFLLLSPAYSEIVEFGDDTYEVSIDKEKKEISIDKIGRSEGSNNIEIQNTEALSVPNTDTAAVATPVDIIDGNKPNQSEENQETFVFADDDDQSRKKTSLKYQRVKQFAEYFAANKNLVPEGEADYKDLLPIEVFSTEIKQLLDQVQATAYLSREKKLTPLDQMKARAIASILISRIETIQSLMGSEIETYERQEKVQNDFSDVDDLKRIAETVEILDFAEKAMQAMGGFQAN